MVCSYEICNIRDDSEVCVTCWFCLDQWHCKCARMRVIVTDIIKENDGIRWCCPNCRKISADFYNFAKNLHSELVSIKGELSIICSRFDKVSNLFSKYPDLDEFASSPSVIGQKRKRSTKKSTGKTVSSRKPSVSRDTVVQSDPVNISDTTESGRAQLYANVVLDKPLEVSKQLKEVVATPELMSTDGASLEKTSQSAQGIQELATSLPVVSSRGSSANVGHTQQPVQRSLSMPPAMKMVFASRFPPETTADEIYDYIRSSIQGDYFLKCYKLRSAFSESRSSFRIVTNQSIFNQIISREFWPVNAFIKEFVERNDKLAHLPPRTATVSKN
ncbi:uncharacterized protein [Musca autumnalis]|uniref:uncharacterized protein n=1 Tax=Musca autumnalis TaxID=221902 RepID=UPI003CE84764